MQTPALSPTPISPPKISHIPSNKEYNQSKKSNNRRKNLHNKNLDKQTRIRRISQGSTTPYNPHTNPTSQITQSHCQSSPKKGISSKIVAFGVEIGASDVIQFGGEDDCADYSEDGD